MTIVPEGHRVVVVHLAPQPTLGRTESGVYVGDTGPHAAGEQLIARVAQMIAADPQARVLLVVQPSALVRELANPSAMTGWLQQLFGVCIPDANLPMVVVPQAQPDGALIADLIQSLGLPVYDVAPDGALFVEIHTPEGVQISLPGAAIPPKDEPVLAEVGWERREVATMPDSAARLRDLDGEMAFIVEKIMAEYAPPTPADLEQLDLARLVTLTADKPDQEHTSAFYRVLLRSQVGAQASAGQQRLPTATLDNGAQMLIAYCDIPAMAQAYPGAQFFEIAALDVLAMANSAGCGVIVENALDGRNSWVGITAQQVTQLLRDAQRTV
jgi:hypothetical protein